MKRQPVLKKPTLDLDLSPKEFRTFYWLKADLQHFCREHELSTAGSKEDLTKRIEHFLLTGKRLSDSGRRANPKMPSEFSLTDEVPLNFRCTREARNFFIQKPGKTFKYSVELQKYIKANPGITFQKVVDHWQFLILQHRLGEKTQIGDQFEYNQFTRDFFAELKKTARKRSPRSGRSKYKIVNSSKLARIRIDEKLVA